MRSSRPCRLCGILTTAVSAHRGHDPSAGTGATASRPAPGPPPVGRLGHDMSAGTGATTCRPAPGPRPVGRPGRLRSGLGGRRYSLRRCRPACPQPPGPGGTRYGGVDLGAAGPVCGRACQRQSLSAAAPVRGRACLRQYLSAAELVSGRACRRQSLSAAGPASGRACLRQCLLLPG